MESVIFLNINKLLENSYRSDLSGYNFAVSGGELMKNSWELPRMGMHGKAFLGYELSLENMLDVKFLRNTTEKARAAQPKCQITLALC